MMRTMAELDEALAAIEHEPAAETVGYADLYRRWEEQPWSATALDLRQDALDWREAFSDARRRAFRWAAVQFLAGEEAVTFALAPYVDAAPLPEQRLFLATQIADEARHAVFFRRFFADVVGTTEVGAEVTPPFRTLYDELLAGAAQSLRERPDDLQAFVRGVVVYHLVVESTLALTGQRHMLEYLRRSARLPGFREGLTAVTRDESRHVGFGVRCLRDCLAADPASAATIEATLHEALPLALAALEPPDADPSYYTVFGYSQEDVGIWALGSLQRKLRAIGVEVPGVS